MPDWERRHHSFTTLRSTGFQAEARFRNCPGERPPSARRCSGDGDGPTLSAISRGDCPTSSPDQDRSHIEDDIPWRPRSPSGSAINHQNRAAE